MASLIHMHIENHTHRNAGDESFASEITLPGPELAPVALVPSSAEVLIIAVGGVSASVLPACRVSDESQAVSSVTVNRHAIHTYRIADGKILLVTLPEEIAAEDRDWANILLTAYKVKRVIILDHSTWPGHFKHDADVQVFQLAINADIKSDSKISALPAPLMLDSVPAAILTWCAESGTPGVAIRAFSTLHDLFSMNLAAPLAAALQEVAAAFEFSTSIAVIDAEYRSMHAAHAKRLRLATPTVLASTMYM